jgi:lipopolysaccharide transport system ATP-binding protein
MQDVSRSGRTVVFVSHNMPAITRLCSRAVLLSAGRIVDDGPADRTVARYLSSELGTATRREWSATEAAPGNEAVRLRSIEVIDEAGNTMDSVDVRTPVGIAISFDITEQKYRFVPGITLTTDEGQPVFTAIDTDPTWRDPQPPGTYVSTAWIPGNLLNEGMVSVAVALGTFSPGGKTIRQAQANDAVAFQVVDRGEGGTARGDFPGVWTAPVRPLLRWTTVHR